MPAVTRSIARSIARARIPELPEELWARILSFATYKTHVTAREVSKMHKEIVYNIQDDLHDAMDLALQACEPQGDLEVYAMITMRYNHWFRPKSRLVAGRTYHLPVAEAWHNHIVTFKFEGPDEEDQEHISILKFVINRIYLFNKRSRLVHNGQGFLV